MAWAAILRTYGELSCTHFLMASVMIGTMTLRRMPDMTWRACARMSWFGLSRSFWKVLIESNEASGSNSA